MPSRSTLRDMLRSAAFAATACLTLTGCAHTNDVLATQPEEIFHVAQAPAEVAACFTAQNHGLRIIEREDGARVARFRNGYGGVTRTFSIYPEAAGSRIEMRSHSIQPFGWRWKSCVGLKPMKDRS